MKTKNGFVSNSSSSSFVVLLPENFLKTIDYEKISDNYIIYNSGDDKFHVRGTIIYNRHFGGIYRIFVR